MQQDGKELLTRPYAKRRALLENLIRGRPAARRSGRGRQAHRPGPFRPCSPAPAEQRRTACRPIRARHAWGRCGPSVYEGFQRPYEVP
ncbi:hypothetical protein [Streptomyces sp. NRRL S-241]|uniref:hypothetical protein n=1 Tax=Streptomyces sp. NRRL S-241 TaxID=1463896 RepID=UPI002D21E216|nr:hypothetical protein [Streptomyces sp. NRRL S-241]